MPDMDWAEIKLTDKFVWHVRFHLRGKLVWEGLVGSRDDTLSGALETAQVFFRFGHCAPDGELHRCSGMACKFDHDPQT